MVSGERVPTAYHRVATDRWRTLLTMAPIEMASLARLHADVHGNWEAIRVAMCPRVIPINRQRNSGAP